MTEPVLASIQTSQGRRILGIGSMWILALIVIAVALRTPPALGWQIFLIALGAGALAVGEAMRRSTAISIDLTETELRDSTGVVIAQIENIVSMDRGMFAFKPSNGFLLKLSERGQRTWRPGVWWRLGKTVGVGGMTPASQAKAMSEIIAVKLAQRDGQLD